jgi:Lrp/AsnC family transcriptional regulator, leucine-responsive regulatory protein
MSAEANYGENRSLDGTDERILRLLEANGRATYKEIADHVHLSANAVRGRVQAMTRRGVIRGFHADIDWDGGGSKIEALIDARLRAGSDHPAFERAAIELPGVVAIEHLAGPVHYQLRASVATMEALDELIQRLQELRVETNTKIITRTLRAG